ncbi:hypothetical protein Tco_1107841 [Tanacetum coccineum]
MLRAIPVSLTGAASRWLRIKLAGSITTWEVLKTKFLSKYCPPARTAKKMEEINNFLQEPDESLFCTWERFKELLMKCPQHHLTDMQEVILFYNGLDVTTRQILDSKGAILTKPLLMLKWPSKKWPNTLRNGIMEHLQEAGVLKLLTGWLLSKPNSIVSAEKLKKATGPRFYQRNNGNSLYPARRDTMEESLSKFMAKSAKSFTETNQRDQVKSISTADLFKIRRMKSAPYDEARGVKILEAYDHNMPQKEKDPESFTLPCFINNVCFDKVLVDLGASVSVMPFSTYTNLGLGVLSHTRLTIELADWTIKQPRGIAENVLVRIGKFVFPIDFIILDIPEDDDVPLILERPFLNYGVTCEDEAKRSNSGDKTKTFEEITYLTPYAVSSKEDTAYQRQLITRIRVKDQFPIWRITLHLYAVCTAGHQSKICS